MRWLPSLLFLLVLAPAASAGPFSPLPPPDSPDGTRAVADLPVSQHHANTGGSDGAGLCVFTSVWHSALWQNVGELDGYRAWMQRRPGGGYPSKVDATLKLYCAERNVPVPPYVQHTGGDAAFLELALRTGRMPAVTYCGRDDFYRGPIAHMVNLVHLDETRAAVLDNNRPGTFLWMTRADFLTRWRGNSGGWAVVLLGPPPPPYATTPGPLPAPTPAPKPQPPRKPRPCPGPAPCPSDGPWEYVRWADGSEGYKLTLSGRFAGVWDAAGWHPATPGGGWLAQPQGEPPIPPPADNYGVDLERLAAERAAAEYTMGGEPATREQVFAAFEGTLTDDSGRWNLSAVGEPDLLARVKSDVAALDPAVRSRLHLTLYAPAAWQVEQFGLTRGVVLRRPAAGRVGAQVGKILSYHYQADELSDLLRELDGPRPLPPIPTPVPEPVPPTPSPAPQPPPVRVPDMIDLTPIIDWLRNFSPTAAAIGAVVLWVVQLLWSRRTPGPAPTPADPPGGNESLLDVIRRIRRERSEADERAVAERVLAVLRDDKPPPP